MGLFDSVSFKMPGTDSINLAGGAVNDLFAAKAYRSKAEGNRQEAEHYRHAGVLEKRLAVAIVVGQVAHRAAGDAVLDAAGDGGPSMTLR